MNRFAPSLPSLEGYIVESESCIQNPGERWNRVVLPTPGSYRVQVSFLIHAPPRRLRTHLLRVNEIG